MREILLINPNASTSTTHMMVGIASSVRPPDCVVRGVTAGRGPQMLITESELQQAAHDVARVWQREKAGCAGAIISAFGDPGIDAVRADVQLTGSNIPVVGICEASMMVAGRDGRCFGVATVTPELAELILGRARWLGLDSKYIGLRCPPGDPRVLAADHDTLVAALATAVEDCIADGAQAVIIGGGPLGQAAIPLTQRFAVPIIAPIPAAMALLAEQLRREP